MFYKKIITGYYEDGINMPCPMCHNCGLLGKAKYVFPDNSWEENWLYKEVKEYVK